VIRASSVLPPARERFRSSLARTRLIAAQFHDSWLTIQLSPIEILYSISDDVLCPSDFGSPNRRGTTLDLD
jgi:hypothetical protein